MNDFESLSKTALELVAPGKGILAADESLSTIEKRFAAHGIPSTEENRRDYRELLFSTPDLGDFISGSILFDETLYQKSEKGMPMPDLLASQGIIPGIKVDCKTAPLPRFPGETFTKGLDSLAEKLGDYRERGARFTKWRAVINIGEGRPSTTAIEVNAQSLAIFAAISQEAGLVPVVEPEVLMVGDHDIHKYIEITETTLRTVFSELAKCRVELDGMLLKTGMVLPGQQCPHQVDADTVAEATVRCFLRAVPAAVPGILFLSGGQSEIEATQRLNAICKKGTFPWTLSISFGRALQETALKTWGGKPANVATAQAALQHRAHCNSLAMQGKYTAKVESE